MSDHQEDIQPSDSVSNVGSRSSTSSAAKLAALRVKLQFQQERALLREEQVRMKNRMDILSAQEEVALSEAEVKAEGHSFTHEDAVRSDEQAPAHPSQAPRHDAFHSFDSDRDIICNMPPAIRHSSPIRRVSPVRQPTDSAPTRPENAQPIHTAGAPSPPPNEFNTSELAQALQDITKVSKQAKLPSAEIPLFDGDPRSYQSIISTFKHVVEENTTDAGTRLNLLIQYTSDKARSVIEDCVLMEPQEGYLEAKKLLRHNFGKPYDIARSYIQGLITGKTVPSDNPDALVTLSRELSKAQVSLNALGYTADINSTVNLQAIARRLPHYLQTRWAEKAHEILEDEREPTFKDLQLRREALSGRLLDLRGAAKSRSRQETRWPDP